MVNGSLAEKLNSDREKIETNIDVELTKDRRRRILTQIASAIGFLHTAVSKFRESYIHGDITTKNIVLDGKYNARLIDFGLARECTAGKEGVTLTFTELLGTPGYFQTSERKKMTLKKDIFCLGVVTLEVLTSMPAKSENKFLYAYKSENIKNCYDDYEEKIERVWGSSYNIVEPFLTMAQKCLKEEVDIKEVIDQFKGECSSLPMYWDDPHKDSQEVEKCFICLINPKSSQVSTLLDHRSCDLHICVQCLRNSYLNPIQCPSCLEKLESPIGNNWAAILVAGNDTENTTRAETFYQDTKSLEKAITSRHPWTIGIGEKHVHCVAARQPGEASQLLPEVENSFKKIKKYVTERIRNVDSDSKFKLHTLLFYFSGHHNADNGFQLGMNGENKEYLSVDGLRKLIIDLYPDCDHLQESFRVIILLDCCNAPVVDLKLDVGITYFQLNSCTVNERTSVGYNKKSLFTECVVQCLKGKSSQEKCPLTQGQQSCKICEDFNPENGFIMIDNLKDFVQQHFSEPKVTFFAQHETMGQNTVFAYFLDTKVEFTFHLCDPLKSSKEYPLPKQPDSLQTLLVDLFQVFKEKYLSKQVKDDFADVLMLEKRTGPKSHHFGELCSLEQIEDAWNGKRKLFVRLRPLDQLSNGKVGCKLDNEKTNLLLKYLTDEKVKATGIANYSQKIEYGITEVAISLENGGARTLWDCLRKELYPSKSCTSFNHLKEVMNIIKSNQELKQEGKLVFNFHLEASGKQIQNFYTIELRPGTGINNNSNRYSVQESGTPTTDSANVVLLPPDDMPSRYIALGSPEARYHNTRPDTIGGGRELSSVESRGLDEIFYERVRQDEEIPLAVQMEQLKLQNAAVNPLMRLTSNNYVVEVEINTPSDSSAGTPSDTEETETKKVWGISSKRKEKKGAGKAVSVQCPSLVNRINTAELAGNQAESGIRMSLPLSGLVPSQDMEQGLVPYQHCRGELAAVENVEREPVSNSTLSTSLGSSEPPSIGQREVTGASFSYTGPTLVIPPVVRSISTDNGSKLSPKSPRIQLPDRGGAIRGGRPCAAVTPLPRFHDNDL